MAQSVEVVDLVSDEEEQLDDGPIDLTNDTPPSSPSRAYQGHQHLQPTAVPAADPAGMGLSRTYLEEAALMTNTYSNRARFCSIVYSVARRFRIILSRQK